MTAHQRADVYAHTSPARAIYESYPDWLKQRLDWFMDLRFGLCIHWAPYTQWDCHESWPLVPADGWARPDTCTAWTGRGKDLERFSRDYWNLNRTFNPVQFDADRWAEIAAAAGIRYVTYTTKHHDGFCMFDTRTTDYRITHPDCPFHADPRANTVRQVFDAFRRRGMGIGCYFSKSDWHCPWYWSRQFPIVDRHVNYDTAAHPEIWEQFVSFVHRQIEELMSNYGHVDLLWLDGGQVRPPSQDIRMDEIAALARRHQPGLLIADRTVGGVHENFVTPEQEIPDAPLDVPWESCITIGKHWKYVAGDVFKSAGEVVRMLVETSAKGGEPVAGCRALAGRGYPRRGGIPPARGWGVAQQQRRGHLRHAALCTLCRWVCPFHAEGGVCLCHCAAGSGWRAAGRGLSGHRASVGGSPRGCFGRRGRIAGLVSAGRRVRYSSACGSARLPWAYSSFSSARCNMISSAKQKKENRMKNLSRQDPRSAIPSGLSQGMSLLRSLLPCTMGVVFWSLASFPLSAPAAVGAKKVDVGKVPEQYQHPIVAMPYAWEKPVIDGAVNDAEWQGAFSQMAMRSVQGEIAARQTRFWIMWDEENFYIAMRSPLRKGERPVQQHRDPSVDTDQIFDDCYEIWISAGQVDTPTGQLDCSAKFISNVSGAHYDTIYQPNVGNERVGSYETGWKPKNRINDRNEWEMELVVPRASLGTTPGPFHDGQHIRSLMARNAKRGWSQDNFDGSSSFSVTDTHSLFVLSKTAPALHLLSVGDADKGEVGMRLAAKGQSDMPIAWKFQSPGVMKDGKAKVAKGKLAEVVNDLAMDKVGEGEMRITVTDAAGRPLLDWGTKRSFALERRPVKDANGKPAKDEEGKPIFEVVNPAREVFNDKGDVIELLTNFNPVRSYLKVQGDFINYDNRAAIQDIEVTVRNADGKELGKSTCRLDSYAYARDLIRFKKLPAGDYTVVTRCLDKTGKALETREKNFTVADLAKKYEWFNTKRGNIETVIKPWTPVTRTGNTLGVWGRDMTIGVAGLPAQITTQGRKLFAEPGRLVASNEGKILNATGQETRTTFDKDYRKIIQVKSQLGDIAVTSDVQVEFDGLYKVTMTLDPKQAATLDKLQIVLPLDEAMADYIHGSAAEIRSGFYYGPMPEGKGKIWDCISLGDATMTKGSFIPYLWVGSPVGGLAWFADSDEGWVPSDTTPAIEIQRNKKGRVELVLNLISERFTLDKPRTLTFGLQASPAKAMYDRWREEKWWCADTFREYARKGDIIWASTPFPDKKHIEESRKIVAAQHEQGCPAVPYFIHSVLPKHLPEMEDLFDEWTTNDGEYGSKALCYRKTLNDFMVHKWGEWARDCGIDGYYVDNMRPIDCNKIEHGCGYLLPDGRVQPVYSMFGTREYFLRSRAAILEERPKSKLVLHMTNAMILPWIGAADVAYDGEHHVIYPRMKKDFMDFWPLDRLRADVPEAWGTAVNFMHEYQEQWDPEALRLAMRAYIGQVALHDILPTGNHNGYAGHFIKQRETFGIGDSDVKFLGYWQKDTGLSAEGGEIKLGAWLKSGVAAPGDSTNFPHSPHRMLLLVANFGEQQDATVKLDTKKLGWGKAAFSVADAEAGYKNEKGSRKTDEEIAAEKTQFDKAEAEKAQNSPKYKVKTFRPNIWKKVVTWDGDKNGPVKVDGTTLTVPVERHNYRLLIITKKIKGKET